MRWEDERYVRFYTRDTPEWLALSWQARGLFGLVLRAVDRAGLLRVGKLGKKGVAVAVHAAWADVDEPLTELLEDGCVVWDEARAAFLIRNYLEAQECAKSDAARKRESRERARAQFGGTSAASEKARAVLNGSRNVTPCPEGVESGLQRETNDGADLSPGIAEPLANGHLPMSQDVTPSGHDSGPEVTNGHDASRLVTPCLAVPCLEATNLRDFATAKVAEPPDLTDLEKGWDPPVLQKLRVAFEATRRSGTIADGIWRRFLAAAQQFSPQIRAAAAQTYLERACATDGKGERYLLGIMRGEVREHHGPSKAVPEPAPIKTTRERVSQTALEMDKRDRLFREEQARGTDPRAVVHRLWLWQRWPTEFPQYAPPAAEAGTA